MLDRMERSLSSRRGASFSRPMTIPRQGQPGGGKRRWVGISVQLLAIITVACMILLALGAREMGGWHGEDIAKEGEERPVLKHREVVHECAHDHFMVPRIEKIRAMRDANVVARLAVETAAAANARRLLQTPEAAPAEAPIRIQSVYQLPSTLSATNVDFIKNVILPNATQFLQRAIRVRQPVVGPLKLTLTCKQLQYFPSGGKTVYQCTQYTDLTCMDAQVDASHLAARELCKSDKSCQTIEGGAGVSDADFVLYVTAATTEACVGNTVAHAGACMFDPVTDRPVAGNANFCPKFFDSSTGSVESRLTVAIHELTHALVFSPGLWPYFRDDYGNPLVPRKEGEDRLIGEGTDASAVVSQFKERGRTVTKLVTPQVVARVREHFGCPTLNGAELEDGGGSGTAGAHWEARILTGEMMEGVSHSEEQIYSPITLGLLEDSGWYHVNYEVGGLLMFGRGRGCDFATGDCTQSPLPAAFKGYTCTESEQLKQCTPDHLAVGYCDGCTTIDIQTQSCLTDGCSRIFGYKNYFCTDPTSDAAISLGQNAGPGSRCFGQGTEPWMYGNVKVASTGAGCFISRCDTDSTGKQKLLVEVKDGMWVDCVDNQMVALPKPAFVSGTLGPCPVAADFCNQINCPDDCNSQGTCYNGTCHCFAGFAGSSCDKIQCFAGKCSSGQSCDNVLGICKNPGPPSPPPPPRPPAPPRKPSTSSGGGGIPSSVVDSAIRFAGLSLDDTSFNSDEFQRHFRDAMLAAAKAAGASSSFVGELKVSIANIRRGSVITESLVQFSPSAGLTYSDADRAGNILLDRINKDPTSIFSSNPYFANAGPITTVRSTTYEGASSPGTGNQYLNRASSTVRRLFKKTWVIVLVAVVAGLIVLAWLYCVVRRCCGRNPKP